MSEQALLSQVATYPTNLIDCLQKNAQQIKLKRPVNFYTDTVA